MSTLERARSDDLLVLNFHGLGPVPDGVPDDERPFWCPEDQFADLLDEISEWTAARLKPSVTITFDDGNDTDATVALPHLVERGLSAIFFVCAGRIDQPRYLSRSQLVDLVGAGMGVQSHGWSHVDWRATSDDEMRTELVRAREVIGDATGRAVDQVAVPFGSYDRRVLGLLRATRWRTVFSSDPGRARSRDWMVARETWDSSWSSERLTGLLAGPPSIRDRLRSGAARRVKSLR